MRAELSIVVPVYNTEQFLRECLDSLKKQSFENIEIVCVNDGSSDSSLAILQEYAQSDDRFIILSQPNKGVSSARNLGIDKASGNYLMFVDSDDYIALNACEEILKIAKRDNSDIVVFGGRGLPQNPWLDWSLNPRNVTYYNQPFKALFREAGSYPLMCNKLYKRELLVENNLHFEQSLTLGEDHAFQFMIFPHAKNVSFTSLNAYFYRMGREGSAVSEHLGDFNRKVFRHLDVVEFVFKYWRDQDYLHGQDKEDLLRWAIDFIYDDAKLLGLKALAQVGDSFASICKAIGMESMMSEDDGAAHKLDYMVSASRFLENSSRIDPEFTILFQSADEVAAQKSILSLLGQGYRNFEILLLDNERNEALSDMYKQLCECDVRISRHVVTGDTRAIYEKLRGTYVHICASNALYDFDFLKDINDYTKKTDNVDLLTVGDVVDLYKIDKSYKSSALQTYPDVDEIDKYYTTDFYLDEVLGMANMNASRLVISKRLISNSISKEFKEAFYPFTTIACAALINSDEVHKPRFLNVLIPDCALREDNNYVFSNVLEQLIASKKYLEDAQIYGTVKNIFLRTAVLCALDSLESTESYDMLVSNAQDFKYFVEEVVCMDSALMKKALSDEEVERLCAYMEFACNRDLAILYKTRLSDITEKNHLKAKLAALSKATDNAVSRYNECNEKLDKLRKIRNAVTGSVVLKPVKMLVRMPRKIKARIGVK